MNTVPEQKTFADAIIESADLDTLRGDIRDALLTHVRSIKVPWTMLSEEEQQDHIDAIALTAESAIRRVVGLIAHRGFPHILVNTGKWTVKDGVKLEVIAAATVDNINRLAEQGTGAAILVLTDAAEFFGEKAPAKADKDQPDLIKDEEDGA